MTGSVGFELSKQLLYLLLSIIWLLVKLPELSCLLCLIVIHL